MKKSVKNSIGCIGQIPKHRDFRKFEKSAPSKIEHLVEFSMFLFMTWSTVQHMETLTSSSILIFQGALVATSFRFFIWFQRDFFKNQLKLKFFRVFNFLLKRKKDKSVTRTGGARKAPADGRVPPVRVTCLIFFLL